MKKRYLIALALSALLLNSCNLDEGDGNFGKPIPPTPTVTDEYNIGGCAPKNCGTLATNDMYAASVQAYLDATVDARAAGQGIGVYGGDLEVVPATGVADTLCFYYGCGVKHTLYDLYNAYSNRMHESFLDRSNREYHAYELQNPFLLNSFYVTNHRSDGTSHEAYPCFTAADRAKGYQGFMDNMAAEHPVKTVNGFVLDPILGHDIPVTYEIGF